MKFTLSGKFTQVKNHWFSHTWSGTFTSLDRTSCSAKPSGIQTMLNYVYIWRSMDQKLLLMWKPSLLAVLPFFFCNIPTFEAPLRKYTYLFLERCRKSNNLWLRALMQSDCLHSSLFFEHYNRILLCEWVVELCSVRLIDGVSSHHAFAFYLDSTNLGISALLRSSAVTSVTC